MYERTLENRRRAQIDTQGDLNWADDDVGNGDSGAKKEKLEAGTLLFSGATDWKQVGRKDF